MLSLLVGGVSIALLALVAWPLVRRVGAGRPPAMAPDRPARLDLPPARLGPVPPDSALGGWLVLLTAVAAVSAAAVRLPLPAPWRVVAAVAVLAGAACWAAYLPWARAAGAWHVVDFGRFVARHLPRRLVRWVRRRTGAGEHGPSGADDGAAALEAFARDAATARRSRHLHAFAHRAAERIHATLRANGGGLFGEGKPAERVGLAAEPRPDDGSAAFRLIYPGGTPLLPVRQLWLRLAQSGVVGHALGLPAAALTMAEEPGGDVLVVRLFSGIGDGTSAAPASGLAPAVPAGPLAPLGMKQDDPDAKGPMAPGLPPLSLLATAAPDTPNRPDAVLAPLATRAVEALRQLTGVDLAPLGYVAGASVLQVLCRMPDGTKADALSNQAANTAAAIGLPSVRVAPHFHLPPGVRGPAGNVIGIEVGLPDDLARPVLPATVFGRPVVRRFVGALPVAVGVAPDGGPVVRDLALFPHLLVGGQTGGGKSVFLHSLILQLILRLPPDRLRLRLADPKAVELSFYEGLPHVDGKVVSTLEDTMALVNAAVEEMENRYALLRSARARDIAGYNAAAAKDGAAPLPHVVLVVDEFADLTAQGRGKAREVFEGAVQRLAQKARAAGVHLVLTTQRPTREAVSPVIKANLPVRVAFRCNTELESRVIIDRQGAEALRGRGDLLFHDESGQVVRAQSPWISDDMVRAVVDWWAGAGKGGGPRDGGTSAGPVAEADAAPAPAPDTIPGDAALALPDPAVDRETPDVPVSPAVAAAALDAVEGWLRERLPTLVSEGKATLKADVLAVRREVVCQALDECGLAAPRVLLTWAGSGAIRVSGARDTSPVRMGHRVVRAVVFPLGGEAVE